MLMEPFNHIWNTLYTGKKENYHLHVCLCWLNGDLFIWGDGGAPLQLALLESKCHEISCVSIDVMIFRAWPLTSEVIRGMKTKKRTFCPYWYSLFRIILWKSTPSDLQDILDTKQLKQSINNLYKTY